MKDLHIHTHPEVEQIFNNYPDGVRDKMLYLRELVIETAKETDEITEMEETLKWGEPGYITKHGSTLRMDWKPKTPNQYAMYFQCTSRLVPTFRWLFGDHFDFEGKRAIVFSVDDEVPAGELKLCIKAALTYHKVKHLATLGM